MNSIEAPRPLNLGEILDRTVQVYRERFLVFLGVAIIPTGVLLTFAGGIFLVLAWSGLWSGTSRTGPFREASASDAGAILLVVVLTLVALAVMLGVSSLSTAAMNLAAAGALAGERLTIRGSFVQAWRRGWMYVGLYILQALIVWIAPLIVWFVALMFLTAIAAGLSRGASPQTAGALVGLVTLFGFAAVGGYALWMLLCVSLAFPACVVEKIGAGDALMRSFRLSKGTRGRIFVLYLLGAVLGWILSIVVTVIFVIIVALIPALRNPQSAQAMGPVMALVIYGSSFAMQAFTKPVYTIALMHFYYDQRIRNEGYDIEWMMERAGLVAGGVTASIELRPEPDGDSTAAPSVEPATAAMETPPESAETTPAHAGVAAEATEQEQSAASESTVVTDAPQPESRVQE